MRLFIVFAAGIIGIPAGAAPFQNYAECIKSLDQALTVTAAAQSLSASTMQSVKGDKVAARDGSEISLIATHAEIVKANTDLVNTISDVCQSMR